jgi:hypothetical protein
MRRAQGHLNSDHNTIHLRTPSKKKQRFFSHCALIDLSRESVLIKTKSPSRLIFQRRDLYAAMQAEVWFAARPKGGMTSCAEAESTVISHQTHT